MNFSSLRGPAWIGLAVIMVIVVAGIGGEELRLWLRYERSLVLDGQWWRLLSGHLVHLGWGHLVLNLAGWLLALALFSDALRLHGLVAAVIVSILCIDVTFLLLVDQLEWYVGWSGVLHGIYMAGALAWIGRGEHEGWVLAVLLVAKLGYEQVRGAVPLSTMTSGGAVIVDAHLAGAVAGAAVGFAVLLRDWRGARR